jgi:hypothetical protein
MSTGPIPESKFHPKLGLCYYDFEKNDWKRDEKTGEPHPRTSTGPASAASGARDHDGPQGPELERARDRQQRYVEHRG